MTKIIISAFLLSLSVPAHSFIGASRAAIFAGKGDITVVPTTPFSPFSIVGSTVTSWYKADAGVTPTTPGDTITAWNDYSTNANHLTDVVGTPNVSTITQNGLPMVYFDGTEVIFGTDKADDDQPQTYFVAFKPTGWGTGGYQSVFNMYKWSPQIGKKTGNTNSFVYSDQGSAAILEGGSVTNQSPTLLTVVVNNASSSIAVNNSAATTGSLNSTRVNTNYPAIGATGSGLEMFIGHVMEIIVYKGVLSSGDQTLVKNYFNAKWAIY